MCARSTNVRHQVGRHAVAGLVDEEAPRQHAERVAAVHREEAAAVVGDLAQHAVGDQLPRVLHQRREAVVVAHAGDDVRGRRCSARHRLRGRAADGLLAEHVLARRRRRLDQLEWSMFGAAMKTTSTAGSSITARQSSVAAARSRSDRPPASRRSGSVSRADHELGVELALREQRRDAQQRAAVRLPEPAEADHPHADTFACTHAISTLRSSCSSASSSAPPDICLTSSSRVMSFLRQSPISRPRLRITKRSPTG